MIKYGQQDITSDDIDAVTKVLTSDNLTQGPVVPFFEENIANLVGSNYAVAANLSLIHISEPTRPY